MRPGSARTNPSFLRPPGPGGRGRDGVSGERCNKGGEGWGAETPPPGGPSGLLQLWRAAAMARWAVLQGAPGRVWGGSVQERAPCGLGSRSRPPRLMERGTEGPPHGPGTRSSRRTECEEVGAEAGRPASQGKAALGSTVSFLGGELGAGPLC